MIVHLEQRTYLLWYRQALRSDAVLKGLMLVPGECREIRKLRKRKINVDGTGRICVQSDSVYCTFLRPYPVLSILAPFSFLVSTCYNLVASKLAHTADNLGGCRHKSKGFQSYYKQAIPTSDPNLYCTRQSIAF